MEPAAAIPPTGPAASAPPGVVPPPRRHVRNFLLDTGLQLRLASYLIAVALALSLGLGWLIWRAYRETSQVVALADPEVGGTIAALLAHEDRIRIVVIGAALVAVLLCLLGAAVVVTHRIAGPAFVIGRTCRGVGEGNLSIPRALRARDLLVDLADDVAGMVEALRARETEERDRVLRAAVRLRDPAASAADRAAAAKELEQLAAEKERRLSS